jgi:hypothetical protein
MIPRLRHSIMNPSRTLLGSARAATAFGTAAGVAALLVVAGCSQDPSPQFQPTGTATLAGTVFFDSDNNGVYSPVAGDSALAGVGVQLRNRGTDSAVARATTDANGRFTVAAPAGTGDLFVESNAALTTRGFVYCGGKATTYLNEVSYSNIPIKLGCVIRILDTKPLAAGARVTVSGIVTAQPGRFGATGNNLYIQDGSSGVQVFGTGVIGSGVQEGDSIEVTGDNGPFNGEPEIVNPKIAANVKKGVGVPAAKDVTVAALAGISSGNAADVGRLVRVRKVRIGDLTGTGSGRNSTITDVTTNATAPLRFDGNVFTALGAQYATATQKCYDITGIVGFFTPAIQLKPRGAQDIVEVPCS